MARSVGSLTKEFPLAEVDRTIALVQDGMQYSTFRDMAERHTHVDIPAIVVHRFLQQREGVLVRDRFLALAESEGLESRRIRKIMYATWALRDFRLRRFILEIVADRNGRWRPAELTRKANARFFEEFFTFGTAPKARSNIEYFLVEAGIFDPGQGAVHLELDDGWLADAVQVAAQGDENPSVRRAMTNDPIGYIIAHGMNGLANATVDELREISLAVVPEVESIEDDEIGPLWPSRRPSRRWNRRQPSAAARRSTTAQINLVARERANRSHHLLERLMAEAARSKGLEPRYNDSVDMFFSSPAGTVLAEMKSCRRTNLHSQVRRGVSQLLEYEYVYAETLGDDVVKVLVLELRPVRDQSWLVEFLEHLGIVVAWIATDGTRLETGANVPPALEGIVHVAAD